MSRRNSALREVTWPVCQTLWDKDGPYQNKDQKRNFFKWLFEEEVQKLMKLKARFMGTSSVDELQWILIE
jgi:hypothetical protein